MISALLPSSCWAKTAQVSTDIAPATPQGRDIVLEQITESLKVAGMNPFQIQGFYIGLSEMFSPGNPKTAAVWGLNQQPPATGQAAPAPTPPPVPTPTPAPPSSAFDGEVNLGLGGRAMNSVKGFLGKGVDVVKAYVGGNQEASARLINDAAKSKHPFGYQLAESLIPDPQNRAKFLHNIASGEWGKALSQGGEALASNSFVKEWSPYVVPAVATMAAARLGGMSGGMSTLLGLGAGAAYGGYIQPNGGFQSSFRKMFGDQPLADGRSPAANTPMIGAPGTQPAQQAPQQTQAQQTQEAGRQSAENILNTGRKQTASLMNSL